MKRFEDLIGSYTGIKPRERVLDRIPAQDRTHIDKFPYRAERITHVDRKLSLPWWHWTHDQLRQGSCVGHGVAMERAITNTHQNRLLQLLAPTRRYDPISIWDIAKSIDEWPDTNPGDDNGTSVHAGYDVCLYHGLSRVDRMDLSNGSSPMPVNPKPLSLDDGVSAVRWITSIDDIRAAIANYTPVAMGISWYSNFDAPTNKAGFKLSWVGEGDLGSVRGGHCVCIYGASDRWEAVTFKNSWGRDYPLCWMPYSTVERLISEDGEFAVSTDR